MKNIIFFGKIWDKPRPLDLMCYLKQLCIITCTNLLTTVTWHTCSSKSVEQPKLNNEFFQKFCELAKLNNQFFQKCWTAIRYKFRLSSSKSVELSKLNNQFFQKCWTAKYYFSCTFFWYWCDELEQILYQWI